MRMGHLRSAVDVAKGILVTPVSKVMYLSAFPPRLTGVEKHTSKCFEGVAMRWKGPSAHGALEGLVIIVAIGVRCT